MWYTLYSNAIRYTIACSDNSLTVQSSYIKVFARTIVRLRYDLA